MSVTSKHLHKHQKGQGKGTGVIKRTDGFMLVQQHHEDDSEPINDVEKSTTEPE